MTFNSVRYRSGLTEEEVQVLIDATPASLSPIPFLDTEPSASLGDAVWFDSDTKELKIRCNNEVIVLDNNEGPSTSVFGTPLGDV